MTHRIGIMGGDVAEATLSTTRIDAPASRRAAPGVGLLLLLLVVAAALRVPGWVVPVFNSDESFLATQAEVLNHGGRLYEDAADRKPPIVPYLYAATFRALHTTGLWSVRLLATIAVALTGWLLALEAHRRWGTRAAWLAGLLFVLGTVAFAPQDGQAANFEIFMLLPMTAGVVLAARRRPASAGVAIAFVLCLCFSDELWKIVFGPAGKVLTDLKVNPPTLKLIDPMDTFQIMWMKVPLLLPPSVPKSLIVT